MYSQIESLSLHTITCFCASYYVHVLEYDSCTLYSSHTARIPDSLACVVSFARRTRGRKKLKNDDANDLRCTVPVLVAAAIHEKIHLRLKFDHADNTQ